MVASSSGRARASAERAPYSPSNAVARSSALFPWRPLRRTIANSSRSLNASAPQRSMRSRGRSRAGRLVIDIVIVIEPAYVRTATERGSQTETLSPKRLRQGVDVQAHIVDDDRFANRWKAIVHEALAQLVG